MNPRGIGEGGPPLPHTFIVVVVIVCFMFCFFFLHSLLSIKKPFLQSVCKIPLSLLMKDVLVFFSSLMRRDSVTSFHLVGCGQDWLVDTGPAFQFPDVVIRLNLCDCRLLFAGDLVPTLRERCRNGDVDGRWGDYQRKQKKGLMT